MRMPQMVYWLHILVAVVLVVPIGLLEHSADWLDCGGSNFLLEDADAEDSESESRIEYDQHCVFVDAANLCCDTLVVPVFPAATANRVQIECAELRGCRPPPNSEIC